MRREWSGWIKARQWSEFEKLAKIDPSQGLVDTIAELELGLPDKPDRKALRKVLYLLSQAGFEPREIEELAAGLEDPIEPIQAAFMVSADGIGDSVITYGKEDRTRVLWLVAHVHPTQGITRAVEDATTLDEAHTKLTRLRNLTPTPYVSAEIPVEFALARLANAVESTKALPPVIAYWRAMLPKSKPLEHPGREVPIAKMEDHEMAEMLNEFTPFYGWRLELGSMAPTLKKLSEEDKSSDGNLSSEAWNRVLAETRQERSTPEFIAEHMTRLLDLAYILSLRGHPSASKVRAIAEELEQKRAESSYAEWMVNRSFASYVQTLKMANDQEKGRP